MLEIINVTLDQLELSPRNVRTHVEDATDVDSLAASILSLGLIQPMVVTKKKGKNANYLVEAGGRRLHAIQKLAADDAWASTNQISCVLVEDTGQMTELSLAENYARTQMRPYEIYQAFAKLRAEKPNATLAELGAMFAYPADRVGRIMRLANLAPEIMDLYAKGEIDDAQAIAFAATEDHDLQRAVHAQLWAAGQPNWKREAREIRGAMKVNDRDQAKLLKFVGVAAYEAAGGRFERDLFAADPETSGRVIDETLLDELTAKKIIDEKYRYAEKLVRNGKRATGEGNSLLNVHFSWSASPPQITQHGYSQIDYELKISHVKRGRLNDEDAASVADLTKSIDDLNQLEEQGDITEEQEDQRDRLLEMRDALEQRADIILPKKGAIVGVAEIDSYGEFGVSLYYASRKEKGVEAPAGAKTKAAGEVDKTPEEREREQEGVSKDSMEIMTHIRRDMIRYELFQAASAGSTLAVDLLVFSLARQIARATPGWNDRLSYNGTDTGIVTISDPDDSSKKVMEQVDQRPERQRWNKVIASLGGCAAFTEDDPAAGFHHYLTEMDAEERNCVAAIIAGHMLLAGNGGFGERRTPRLAMDVMQRLQDEPGFVRWRDNVTLDEGFFALLGTKRRKELLIEFGQADRAGSLKAGETARHLARVVNANETDARLLGIESDEDRAHNENWLPDCIDVQQLGPLERTAAPEPEADEDEAALESLPTEDEIAEAMAQRAEPDGTCVTINGREHVMVNGVPVDAEALAELSSNEG